MLRQHQSARHSDRWYHRIVALSVAWYYPAIHPTSTGFNSKRSPGSVASVEAVFAAQHVVDFVLSQTSRLLAKARRSRSSASSEPRRISSSVAYARRHTSFSFLSVGFCQAFIHDFAMSILTLTLSWCPLTTGRIWWSVSSIVSSECCLCVVPLHSKHISCSNSSYFLPYNQRGIVSWNQYSGDWGGFLLDLPQFFSVVDAVWNASISWRVMARAWSWSLAVNLRHSGHSYPTLSAGFTSFYQL